MSDIKVDIESTEKIASVDDKTYDDVPVVEDTEGEKTIDDQQVQFDHAKRLHFGACK
jgi:hypothetical protein